MKFYSYLISICCLICISGCNEKIKETQEGWTSEEREFIVSELERTTAELENELRNLSEMQANFTTANNWSIKEIVAHLEMQNQLHFREISVTSKAPSNPEFSKITRGMDEHFKKYATDPQKGTSQWFLDPGNKYDSLETAWEAFKKAREALVQFVSETKVDLRNQFTYRAPVQDIAIEDLQIGQVRDLHQLLLTGIAHTDRHLTQIRNIKEHPDFPVK